MTHYKADSTNDLADTFAIQLKSLWSFANYLGYEFTSLGIDGAKPNSFFYSGYKKDVPFKSCEVINFMTMVKLHNTSWVHSSRYAGHLFPYPGGVHTATTGQPLRLDSNSPFHVDAYTLNKAQAAKIVTQVYLNGGKGGVSCYRDLVKFVDPVYEQLFLSPIIEQTKESQDYVAKHISNLYEE